VKPEKQQYPNNSKPPAFRQGAHRESPLQETKTTADTNNSAGSN